MNQANRWTKQALKHVRVLSKSIGARGATSDAEKRAAGYVKNELERIGLRDVREEPFQGSVSTWLPLAIAFSIAAWAMLIGLLLGLAGAILGAALNLVATWIIYRELFPTTHDRSVRRWLWQGDSQNVLGAVPSAEPAQRRVVLMSYLDSASTPFFWRTQERRRLVRRVTRPLFFSLPLSAVALFLGATITFWLYLIALVLLIPQSAALIICVFADRGPVTPGANNNASGVGTMLALAERLKETPLATTEIWVLATGCRETGAGGIRAFLDAHAATLAETTFIALEGVGVGERIVYLTSEGTLRDIPYPAQPLALAAQAAEHCRQDGIECSAEHHWGSPTEMALIIQGGFKGTTINVWSNDWPGAAGRRHSDDTFDTIEQETLDRVHTFAWALLQEIDATPENA